ncbi:ACP S-malonyltransferase [Paenibacillus sp. HN-1]|uniref:ACP S-malonyltransferase n=1 Tax=Paenibacillus TaxID=44249 RepID=UPI001CAA1B65|nr:MULTISPECIES: ACP S-malonyltransferase [Paenibacillus]MBY9077389.1 ACP S-malonyltransferase [Paenibacillus sp. CGMCC 1.18879]MBY9087503.1 ACP S-malonyltransferase [Paenibacillus sinensis]
MEYEWIKSNFMFMFPGVGSQYFGMGRELYKSYPIVRETFEEASDELKIDFHNLCFEENNGELNLLEYTKPALVCLCVAIYRVFLQQTGIEPKFGMGYSLGEYTALCCAGVLRYADTLQIVHQRALIVNEVAANVHGTMAWVVNIERNMAKNICNRINQEGYEIYISSYDSQEKLSVSGTNEGIQQFARIVEDAGGMVIPIKMSGPFHSPLMKEAAVRLREVLNQFKFQSSRFDVIANRDASVYGITREGIIENLVMQLVEPIMWDRGVNYAAAHGIKFAIELGPKNVLKFLLRDNTRGIRAYSVEKAEDIQRLLDDITLPLMEYGDILKKSLGVVVSTKNQCNDKERYESHVAGPYNQLIGLYKESNETGKCTGAAVKEAVDLLQVILQTKGSSKELIDARIRKLLNGRVLLEDTRLIY